MKKLHNIKKTIFIFLCLTILSFVFVFTFQGAAINKTLRLAPLANGWVSEIAELQLTPTMSLLDKYQYTVRHDLGVGRYRPASFLYTTLSYALSPLAHDRLYNDDKHDTERKFHELVTGDLRLIAFIYLVAVSFILAGMSLLVFLYSGSILVSLIPVCFISISPELSGNLLQNYIDSQEIPLTVVMVLWTFFFFLGLKNASNHLGNICILFSTFLLFLIYLTKETACVMAVSVLMSSVFVFIKSATTKKTDPILKERVFYSINIIITLFLTYYVYYKVVAGNTQYGTGYKIVNFEQLWANAQSVWRTLSWYSVNNYFTIGLLILAVLLLIRNRNRSINGIPVRLYASLFLFSILSGYGFFLMQIPWQYSLVKYLLPSIFFLSFSVALAIPIIAKFIYEKYENLITIAICLVYMMTVAHFYHGVRKFTSWYYENATYGTSIIYTLAKSIDNSILSFPEKDVKIFVEYGTDAAWGKFVPWGKLHLMRILNIEKHYNILDHQGKYLMNVSMPEYALTSFRYNDKQSNLYITNRREELSETPFDVVYKGYPEKIIPPEQLLFHKGDILFEYVKTDESIDYRNKFGLPQFSLFKYIPVR